jgi:hypothetical protein
MAVAKKNEAPVSEDPHFDENPEDHMGDEIKDPWSDPDQLDWPNNEEEN